MMRQRGKETRDRKFDTWVGRKLSAGDIHRICLDDVVAKFRRMRDMGISLDRVGYSASEIRVLKYFNQSALY